MGGFFIIFRRLLIFKISKFRIYHPCTLPDTILETTTFKSNNLNYFFLITTSIFIITPFLFPAHQLGYEKQINMCFFMSMESTYEGR
jgi:hypothetical protein